jgi:hypothetical protein
MHKEADRILRSQGNGSGRQRMRSDTSIRPATPPRGLILSTGEDVPRGQSLQARMFVVEMEPTDLKFDRLTMCQELAADGVYSAAMAGYLSWLARDYGLRRRSIVSDLAQLRAEATSGSGHRRTPEITANLMLGMKTFLAFALECGAITEQEAAAYTERAWNALRETAGRQDQQQQASDPVNRFLALLASAVATGQAHIATPNGEKPGSVTQSFGWRQHDILDEWRPQGKCVGWLDGENLYLDPNASYQVAQGIGSMSGESLSIAPRTLHMRMRERGLLASVDQTRGTSTVRKQIEGNQHNVLHVLLQALYPDSQTDKTDNGLTLLPRVA